SRSRSVQNLRCHTRTAADRSEDRLVHRSGSRRTPPGQGGARNRVVSVPDDGTVAHASEAAWDRPDRGVHWNDPNIFVFPISVQTGLPEVCGSPPGATLVPVPTQPCARSRPHVDSSNIPPAGEVRNSHAAIPRNALRLPPTVDGALQKQIPIPAVRHAAAINRQRLP